MDTSLVSEIQPNSKHNFSRALLITQISIYLFIILHSITWHVFGIHIISKLCPFVFAEQVGNLEFNWVIIFWILIFGSTLFLGRAFCAWGCMFGAYQDFVFRIAARLKSKSVNNKFAPWIIGIIGFLFVLSRLMSINMTWPELSWPTLFWYIVIIISAGLAIWILVEKKASGQSLITLPKYIWLGQYLGGIVLAWITLNIFHTGITFAFDKYGILDHTNWWFSATELVVVGTGIVIAERRIFCKYICPIGLVFGFFSALPFPKKYKVRSTGEKCTQCNRCTIACLAGLNPMQEINNWGYVKNPNCINCLECVSTCHKNAIEFAAGGLK